MFLFISIQSQHASSYRTFIFYFAVSHPDSPLQHDSHGASAIWWNIWTLTVQCLLYIELASIIISIYNNYPNFHPDLIAIKPSPPSPFN